MGKSFPVAAVVRALKDSYGLLTAAAARLGCHRDTITNYAEQFEEVRAALIDQRERLKDLAELALVKKINDGDLGAICFFLKTQAKDRGYIERTETLLKGRIEHSLAPPSDDQDRVRLVAAILLEAGILPVLAEAKTTS